MNNRDFTKWLSTFRDTIADYGYYVDFEKVKKNVNSIKVELNILNSLIGSKDIANDFVGLVEKYPEILRCIPLLIAVRKTQIYAIDGDGEYSYDFKNPCYSLSQYCYFMQKTGLFDLLSHHLINNCMTTLQV